MRCFACLFLMACTSSPAIKDAGADAGQWFDQGTELKVPVPAMGSTFVRLDPLAIVTPADPKTSMDWDLQFSGWDVFTSSGPSGPGQSVAFGPLDTGVFFDSTVPDVPFLYPDSAGGAFYRWYAYDGGGNHTLYSRWHIYGIKDGGKQWKLQILSYYGVVMGAPVSAIYGIRWAEVTQAGSMPTQTLMDLDGTAGFPNVTTTSPNECIDLGTGARTMLSPADQQVSMVWHLCFRRDKISVNGELGGPRGVTAADFDFASTPTEMVDQVKTKTAASEQARFDAIALADYAGKTFRGDRVISAYTDLWIDRTKTPIAPRDAAFLSYAADGKRAFVVGFPRFEGATADGPGTVVLRVKGVK
jgi:hypothetical protein